MIDNGTQLKSIGMQLQPFCSQIQNIAFQLININQILGKQLQNVSFQISNLVNQILNIGFNISRKSNNFQNFGIISNNMNNIDLVNNNECLNLNKEINNYSNENIKINILFKKNTDSIASVFISWEKTLKELFDSFIIKAGLNHDYLNKNWFIFNGKRIFPNNEIKIKDMEMINNSWIQIIE